MTPRWLMTLRVDSAACDDFAQWIAARIKSLETAALLADSWEATLRARGRLEEMKFLEHCRTLDATEGALRAGAGFTAKRRAR